MRDANNLIDYFDSEGYIRFDEAALSSTKDLYENYRKWCDDNAETLLSAKTFANYISQYAGRYHLVPDNNIYIGKGRRCRGYKGIEIIHPENPFYQ